MLCGGAGGESAIKSDSLQICPENRRMHTSIQSKQRPRAVYSSELSGSSSFFFPSPPSRPTRCSGSTAWTFPYPDSRNAALSKQNVECASTSTYSRACLVRAGTATPPLAWHEIPSWVLLLLQLNCVSLIWRTKHTSPSPREERQTRKKQHRILFRKTNKQTIARVLSPLPHLAQVVAYDYLSSECIQQDDLKL